MPSVRIDHLITHEHPDFDAILSILLIRLFGEDQFPGVRKATISFCPAGILPDSKTPDELEREGILVLDIGGGRFDTHPTGNQLNSTRRDRCAADLVAEAVGVLENPAWVPLIEYARQQDTAGKNLRSRDYLHHLTSVPIIISGLEILFDGDSRRVLDVGMEILEAVSLSLQDQSRLDSTFQPVALIKEMVDRYLLLKEIDPEKPLPSYKNFVEWRTRLIENPGTAFSSHSLDQGVSLPALVTGLWRHEKGNKEGVLQKLQILFDAIIAREASWNCALAEFDQNASVSAVGKVRIARIESENGLAIKAVRFRCRADLIIYRNPRSGATCVLINRRGPLSKLRMQNLAAKVRIAEYIESGNAADCGNNDKIGMANGWFLHQSENMLIRGSQKASYFTPSRISMQNLEEIAISEVDSERKIPRRYCPDNCCLGEPCLFYRLYAETCKNHRKRNERTGARYTLEEKLSQALRAKEKVEDAEDLKR